MMRRVIRSTGAVLLVLFVFACSDDGGAGQDEGDAGADTDTGPPDITERDFGSFDLFDEPIFDFIETHVLTHGEGGFSTGIFDLTVHDDRLYLGYGDATNNLGSVTPIELRYYPEPDPATLTFDFTTDEEQVDRFRHGDDALLVPGVDATEDDLLGNVYSLTAGDEWYKSRTLELAWHVHDVAKVGETLYACGSGGTIDDYNNSTVNALFFRSDDSGENFVLADQIPHPAPPGDHRLTNLLPVGDLLAAFGYASENVGGSWTITTFPAYQLEGETLAVLDGFSSFFVTATQPMTDEVGLAVGVNVDASLSWGCKLVHSNGDVTTASMCEDRAILDSEPLGDGRLLLLYLDDGTYPTPVDGPWDIKVGVTDDGETITELSAQQVDVLPLAISFWRDSLFMGMNNGTIMQAQDQSP